MRTMSRASRVGHVGYSRAWYSSADSRGNAAITAGASAGCGRMYWIGYRSPYRPSAAVPTVRRHLDERSFLRCAFRSSAAQPAGRGDPGTLAPFPWVGPRGLGIEPERPGGCSRAGLLSHSRRTSNHSAESSDTVSPDRGAKIPASCAPRRPRVWLVLRRTANMD